MKNITLKYIGGVFLSVFLAISLAACGSSSSGGDGGGNELEIKTEVTDSNGQTTFIDNSTQDVVIVKVVDSYSNSPLQNIEVTYYDGVGYEVFSTYDLSNEYLPSIGIYAHNSTHIIETKKVADGSCVIYVIDDEDTLTVFWKWENENHMNDEWYNYVRTVDYDEMVEIQGQISTLVDIFFKGILYILALEFPFTPSDILDLIAPEELNPPQRYDIYEYGGSGYAQYNYTILPSNIPIVSIETIDVNGNNVDISWVGTDKDTYEDRLVFLPNNQDLTKYIDGNSTSDLTYSYRITQNGVVYNGYDWTPYESNTSATINIPDNGTYIFELRVKDEVDNVGSGSCILQVPGPANAPDWGGGWIHLQSGEDPQWGTCTRTQSFILNSSYLETVEVGIINGNPGLGDDVLTLTILSQNQIQSEISQTVQDGFDGWLRFIIPDGPLYFLPGNTLVIQLKAPKLTFGWKYSGGNTYPDGRAFVCCYNDERNPDYWSQMDFFFKINH